LAFKVFARRIYSDERLEKGQEWYGETIDENLAFCEFEGCSHIFEKFLSKNGLVLESGCGLGKWVLFFKNRGFKIIGCDIDYQALTSAKDYDPSAYLIRADVHNLPFKDCLFDAIISLGVIEHFKNGPHKILEETKRLLKPNGLLFVAVPHNSFFRRFIVNHFIFLKMLLLRALRYKTVFTEYRYTKEELMGFLKYFDFEILSCYPEMLIPPKHIGMYIDYIHLTGIIPKNKFETPRGVSIIANRIKSISPWLISGMVLCVARRKS